MMPPAKNWNSSRAAAEPETPQITWKKEISGPEPIEGWAGKIYGYPAAMQFDDYFVLEGKYSVQFGIASSIDEGGLPIYAEALAGLQATGQTVLVPGQLMCGVPDTDGCQNLVNRLQVEEVEIVVNSK